MREKTNENKYLANNYISNALIEKNEVKAGILLFLLKNRVIYPNFIAKKLFSMNPNAARGYIDRMASAGVVERIAKEDLPEAEDFEILLRKYTQLSGGKLIRIEYYTLTDFSNKKVGELSKEFESIIPGVIREKIDDVLKAIIPAERLEEKLELQKRVEGFKAKQEAEKKKKEARKQKAREKLLELCSPFKDKILKLDERVVMGEPSEDQHFTPGLLAFVKKLQEKEKFISPLGVREVWQIWRKDSEKKEF